MSEDHHFLYASENGPFVIESTTICGEVIKARSVPQFVPIVRDKIKDLVNFLAFCNLNKELIANKNFPSCMWLGGLFHYAGYCTMNRNFVFGLVEKGANVKTISSVGDIDINFIKALEIAKNTRVDIPSNSPVVWGSVQSKAIGKRYLVHFTMSETEGYVNKNFLRTLERDDEVWVPTEWDKEKMENSGLNKPIKSINLGVDVETFKPSFGDVFYTSGVNKFVFITVSAWNWRKGHDALIKAYLKAFSFKDDVSLVMLTREGDTKFDVLSGISRIFGNISVENFPHIILSKAKIPDESMPHVYSSANAFALMSRGEGWGLPYCEAAACGLPIIGSDHGGQKTFLKNDDSFLIKPDRLVDAPEEMIKWSDIYENCKFVDFSDDAIDEISKKMRWVYENYQEAKRISKSCSERIRNEFSWDKPVEKVYNRLVELQ